MFLLSAVLTSIFNLLSLEVYFSAVVLTYITITFHLIYFGIMLLIYSVIWQAVYELNARPRGWNPMFYH